MFTILLRATEISHSVSQYAFNATMSIAHGCKKFKKASANNTVAKDEKIYIQIHRYTYRYIDTCIHS